MVLSNALTSETAQLRDDLLWCVASPALVEHEANWLANKRFRQSFAEVVSEQIERKPNHFVAALSARLRQLKTHRLGERFEALCQLAIELHPDYQLLAHNYPVRSARKTLGELDMLVQHSQTNEIFHLELACKFYLQVKASTGDDIWMGPGLKDRLDRKLQRMNEHQLPLAHTSTTRQLLQQQGWQVQHSYCWLKGRLFYPVFEANGTNGFWGERQQLWQQFGQQPWRWQILRKTQWMAPLRAPQSLLSLSEVLSETIERPVQVAAFEHGVEQVRGFWVPETWAEQAASAVA